MRNFEYRGYLITPHGRRWRVQVRPKPIVRDTVEEVKQALDVFLEARDRERQARDSHVLVAGIGIGHISVAELCDAWFRWKTSPKSDEPIRARTRRDYRRSLDKFIVPLIGSLDAATVTTNELKRSSSGSVRRARMPVSLAPSCSRPSGGGSRNR